MRIDILCCDKHAGKIYQIYGHHNVEADYAADAEIKEALHYDSEQVCGAAEILPSENQYKSEEPKHCNQDATRLIRVNIMSINFRDNKRETILEIARAIEPVIKRKYGGDSWGSAVTLAEGMIQTLDEDNPPKELDSMQYTGNTSLQS